MGGPGTHSRAMKRIWIEMMLMLLNNALLSDDAMKAQERQELIFELRLASPALVAPSANTPTLANVFDGLTISSKRLEQRF